MEFLPVPDRIPPMQFFRMFRIMIFILYYMRPFFQLFFRKTLENFYRFSADTAHKISGIRQRAL